MLLQFIKNWILPIAMLLGILLYPWISYLSFLTPYLIFTMLLVTFCKLSPREIHFQPAHAWLLIIQLTGTILIYYLLSAFFDPLLAQGAMICVIVPTATSAAVVTGMLGGSVAFLTSYLLLSNIAVAILAPALFPIMGAHTDLPFMESFIFICKQVGPVLLLPLFCAWGLRYGLPMVHRQLIKMPNLSFYLWAVALTIVTGSTVNSFMKQEQPNYIIEAGLALVSLFICIGQFLLGRRIGRIYGDPVSSGQGLGQKNTILAIWMAQTYFNPVSAIAPAAYVLWQNSINSYQLWLRNRESNRY